MAFVTNQKEIDGNNTDKHYGPKATLAQIFATLAQSFLLIGLGMELSMSTIVIQALYKKSEDGDGFSLTLSDMSWYGSILFVFHPTGSFLSGFLQERYGRKRCMIFANVPSVLGWILLYRTESVAMLYASTVLMGLSIGFSEAPILSYVGEITEPKLRGSMSSLACTTPFVGSFATFALGYLFKWRTVALLSALCPITCMCLVGLIPESPVWLIGKGKNEKAQKSLRWLRGWTKPEAIEAELHELVQYNLLSGTRDGKTETRDITLISKLKQFKDPSVYRPLRLVMIVFFVSALMGISPCKPYLGKIMTELNIPADTQKLFLVLFSVLQFIGSISVVLTVRCLGKRFLTILSFLINTVLLCSLAVYVIASKDGYFDSTHNWIPLTILCAVSCIGAIASSLPWILLGEIFSNKSRGLATGSCAGMVYMLMFVLTKLYLTVELVLSFEYMMVLFSCIGVFGLAYVYRCLPETENRTLLEIEEYFVPESNKSRTNPNSI